MIRLADEPDGQFVRPIAKRNLSSSAAEECAMRSIRWPMLAVLIFAGVIVAPLTFNDSAMAASSRAKLAHKSRAGSCARPLRFSAQQLVPAMLNLSLGAGPRDALIIDGVRVPIRDCGPAATNPYTGEVIDNRPTASGSAWIARMKRNSSRRASRNR